MSEEPTFQVTNKGRAQMHLKNVVADNTPEENQLWALAGIGYALLAVVEKLEGIEHELRTR